MFGSFKSDVEGIDIGLDIGIGICTRIPVSQ